jgi:dTDP-4-dehydrorhamnose 3,5-epimerase
MISGLSFKPLKRIATPNGEVRHGLKVTDEGFEGFGEAYFTEVFPNSVKGWKRHKLMTMNLVIVSGTVRFVIHNGRGELEVHVLSVDDHVPPGVWMAFQGVGLGLNLILNLASHMHDPNEAEVCELDVFTDMMLRAEQLHA